MSNYGRISNMRVLNPQMCCIFVGKRFEVTPLRDHGTWNPLGKIMFTLEFYIHPMIKNKLTGNHKKVVRIGRYTMVNPDFSNRGGTSYSDEI